MKTNLNRVIACKQDAIDYLTELYNNGESYHCDDSAQDIIWGMEVTPPTTEEIIILDSLMDQVHQYHEDPCGVMMDLYYLEDENNEAKNN